jgi:hypothetical protein
MKEKFSLDRDATISREWLKCGVCNYHVKKDSAMDAQNISVPEVQREITRSRVGRKK